MMSRSKKGKSIRRQGLVKMRVRKMATKRKMRLGRIGVCKCLCVYVCVTLKFCFRLWAHCGYNQSASHWCETICKIINFIYSFRKPDVAPDQNGYRYSLRV